MTGDMDVARLTGATRMCPQSNKSILPTFVLSKVEKLLHNEKPITLQKEDVQTQNSKLKIQNSKLKTQNSKLKTQNSKLKKLPQIIKHTQLIQHIQRQLLSFSNIIPCLHLHI